MGDEKNCGNCKAWVSTCTPEGLCCIDPEHATISTFGFSCGKHVMKEIIEEDEEDFGDIGRKRSEFEQLKGKVIEKISINKTYGVGDRDEYGDSIWFECRDGSKFHMYHIQYCCETVGIEDICGDIDDICGKEILLAECVSNEDNEHHESATWTFYKLSTISGSVTIRWLGESNGYYSEYVDFFKVK